MSVLGGVPEVYCGCLGCKEAATVVIDHEQHGERLVCDSCADGHEVVRDV